MLDLDRIGGSNGEKILLVSKDPDPHEEKADDKGEKKTKPPIVVTRLQFKRDEIGYLDNRRTHIYILDLVHLLLEEYMPEIDPSNTYSTEGRHGSALHF